MNRTVLLAALVASAAPAFAADECLYLGTTSSSGALICQAGVMSQCTASHWAPTQKPCSPETRLSVPPPVQQVVAAPPPAPVSPYLLHVMTASYTVGDTGTDVVFALRSLCDGKPSCSVAGDARLMGGDPAPRIKGKFSVIYECTTGFQSRGVQHDFFAKHATIKLGCP
jgi:hypothetical protein